MVTTHVCTKTIVLIEQHFFLPKCDLFLFQISVYIYYYIVLHKLLLFRMYLMKPQCEQNASEIEKQISENLEIFSVILHL